VATKLYRRSPAIEETTVGERAVLYHCVSGNAVVLNPTASILWAELADETDSARLGEILHGRFPATDRDRVMSDVARALEEMERQQLVVAH
jgi:hypothetical protein